MIRMIGMIEMVAGMMINIILEIYLKIEKNIKLKMI
jgi:hypothetical protein